MKKIIIILFTFCIAVQGNDIDFINKFQKNLKRPLLQTTAYDLVKQNPGMEEMILERGFLIITYPVDSEKIMKVLYITALGPLLTGYPQRILIGSPLKDGKQISKEETAAWLKFCLPNAKLNGNDMFNRYTTATSSGTVKFERKGDECIGISILNTFIPAVKKKIDASNVPKNFVDFVKKLKPIYAALKPVTKEKMPGFRAVKENLPTLNITADEITLNGKAVQASAIKDGKYRLKWDRTIDYRKFCLTAPAIVRASLMHNGSYFTTTVNRKNKVDLKKGFEVKIENWGYQCVINHAGVQGVEDILKRVMLSSDANKKAELHFTYYLQPKISIKALEAFISKIPAGMPFSVHTSNEVETRGGVPGEFKPTQRDQAVYDAKDNRESAETVHTKVFRFLNLENKCWGDKNSLLCTALTLCTVKEYEVLRISPAMNNFYMDSVMYLVNNIAKASGDDARFMLMTLSNSFRDNNNQDAKKMFLHLISMIEKDWIPANKAAGNLPGFYLQALALKTAKNNGVVYNYSKIEKEISSINPGNNVVLLACCLMWDRKVNVPEAIQAKLLKMLPASTSFINDLIIKDVLFNSGKSVQAKKLMKAKFAKLDSGSQSYVFDKKFSDKEKVYLNKMIPTFINGTYFTINVPDAEDEAPPVEEPEEFPVEKPE